MKLQRSLALGALVALGLTACGSTDNGGATTPGAASSGSTAGSTQPITMKVAVASKLAGHWPLWSGIDEGIFKKAGINVEVVTVQTDTAGVQALQSGSVDFIIGTIPQIISANAAGAQLVGVGAVQNRPIYRMIASKGMTDATQLKGKNIGVSEVKLGIDSFLMQAWLATKGLNTGDYTLVGTGAVSTRVAALSSGGVSAVAIPPPGDTPVIAQGYADLGYATDTIQHLQWTLLVATQQQLDAKGDDYRRFLAAYTQAAKFVADPANAAAAKQDLMKETQADAASADASYKLMVGDQGISFDGKPDDQGITAWEKLLNVQDIKPKVYNGSYLPGAP